MEKLKILNLISVLKNLNKKELKYVLSNMDALKLNNISNKLICDKCDVQISMHNICNDCRNLHCNNILYSADYDNYLCLNCCYTLYVKINNYGFDIIYESHKITFDTTVNSIENGPISKEKVLKLMEKYFYY